MRTQTRFIKYATCEVCGREFQYQHRDTVCRDCRRSSVEESLSDPLADHDRYDEESGPNDTFDDGWNGSTPVNI